MSTWVPHLAEVGVCVGVLALLGVLSSCSNVLRVLRLKDATLAREPQRCEELRSQNKNGSVSSAGQAHGNSHCQIITGVS